MTQRDAAGNILKVGDLVAVGAQGIIIGTVQKADTIVSGDPNSPPMVHVGVIFPLPVQPNGFVNGVMKIAQPAPASQVVGEA